MAKYIVTTTIYPPSKSLKEFARKEDWTLIVAGDKKTPHEEYRKQSNIIYLDPEYQETHYRTLSDLTGWNCTTRRNFGYLEALRRGADIIASVDDDNIPGPDWGTQLLLGKSIMTNIYTAKNGVFDPFSPTNHNNLWHRGYPLDLVHSKNDISMKRGIIIPDIQADFWNGDPDIDAIERMIYAPTCDFDTTRFPFSTDNSSPFNSQNTFFTRVALQNYFMFPGTGRMEDIWGAYYSIAKGAQVIYNAPSVIQERNPHNYLTDFSLEITGYQQNSAILKALDEDPENIKNFLSDNSYKALKEYQRLTLEYKRFAV